MPHTPQQNVSNLSQAFGIPGAGGGGMGIPMAAKSLPWNKAKSKEKIEKLRAFVHDLSFEAYI